MNLLDSVKNVFIPEADESIEIVDKFTSYSISYYISNFKNFNQTNISELLSLVNSNDTFSLSLKIGENDAIVLNKLDSIDFQTQIHEERQLYEDEPVQFRLEIKKETSDVINIYDFQSFEFFWGNLPLISILGLFKKYQNSKGQLNFIFLEDDVESFNTKHISFSTNSLDFSLPQSDCVIAENCHFGNIADYPFDAFFFHLVRRPSKSNPITTTLDELSFLFSIISLFDITSIKQSTLYYKLNGYKTFEGQINLNEIDIKLAGIYFKIVDWVYSEKSNISDKIGLTRNVLSLSLEQDSVSISEDVYLSIQSGYKAYLQENISKYIEIRNKIVDELSWISDKVSEVISSYLGNYQKSIFTFLSFFISVFILRFLKGGNTSQVFSKEVTIFSLAFLVLSGVFLVFSRWNLTLEKDRIERKYNNLKNRYTDLLDQRDIDRILKDNEEFDYELDYLKKRNFAYTALWIITIILLASVVLSVSSYLNWEVVSNFIENWIETCIHTVCELSPK